MSDIHDETIKMTPQISPKDIPQDRNEPEEEEEPVYGNVVQESSSSEDDDDEEIDTAVAQGYVPLSMNDANETSDAVLEESEFNKQEFSICPTSEDHTTSQGQNEEAHDETDCDAVSLPSIQHDSVKEVPMDNDQVHLIQQVMSRISLPSSSIPDWANVIPEDKWKNSLLTSLEKRTHSSSSSKCKTTDPEK